jgi:hypothetical protein
MASAVMSRKVLGALQRRSSFITRLIQSVDLDFRFNRQLSDFSSQLQEMKTQPLPGKKASSEIVKRLKECKQELEWTDGAFEVKVHCERCNVSPSNVLCSTASSPRLGTDCQLFYPISARGSPASRDCTSSITFEK